MTTAKFRELHECLQAMKEIRAAISTVITRTETILAEETNRGTSDCTHPEAVDATTSGGGPRMGFCPDCNTMFELEARQEATGGNP